VLYNLLYYTGIFIASRQVGNNSVLTMDAGKDDQSRIDESLCPVLIASKP